jgi:two-component system, response regulator
VVAFVGEMSYTVFTIRVGKGGGVNQTILLVEDNPNDEALTRRALRGIIPFPVVVTARDGVEALDFIFSTGDFQGRATSASPTIVLLDLKVPRLSALEVLRRIRDDAYARIIPVIIFTSSSQEQDILDAYTLGANSYVCKPVDYRQFCHTLKQVVTYWLGFCRLPPAGSTQRTGIPGERAE